MCRLCGRMVKCIFDSMPSRAPQVLSTTAPRAHLFTRSTTFLPLSRTYTTSTPRPSTSPFNTGPSPPRLPKEEQDIFEALQRQSTGAFSTPRSAPSINQSPDSSPSDLATAESMIDSRKEKMQDAPKSQFKEDYQKIIEARGKGEELHPNVRVGARPEFNGERNPKTGEVGGPKNEPLRWGAGGEWSYNGRTTDF